MTSKEALEIIVRKHCVSETDEENEFLAGIARGKEEDEEVGALNSEKRGKKQ